MDPNLITPQQATASLTKIVPFLWPFVLLSLGVALTPISPISWSYSTWLLFIVPLTLTVFAPIRTFSGPLRFAYLEYASKIASLAVTLLKGVIVNFHSLPTLALPALFFLPVLPILFFIFFPALPTIWHFIAYHYRRRLKAISTSVAKTKDDLDLAMAHARQATNLAHTYEKEALYTVSTTRSTPSLALSRHSTEFGSPVFNDSEGGLRLTQSPGTLGADLAAKVLDTEKRMAEIEGASQEVRALSEEAIAVATEGDMAAGEQLAEKASRSLETLVKQADELRLVADKARATWIDFRLRLKAVSTSVAKTLANLDLATAHASQAMELAHTYEKQALYTVSTTRNMPSLALSHHSTEFGKPVFNDSEDRWQLTPSPGTLGGDLAEKVLDTEKRMAEIEGSSQEIRALSEEAIAVATEGDMVAGEKLAEKASRSLEMVVKRADELRTIADQARCTWIDFRLRLKAVGASVAKTLASLDLATAHASQAMELAHTYEKVALYTVSTTRNLPSLALSRHSTEFGKPEFNDSEDCWQLTSIPGTLGGDLADKVLDTEKQMAEIKDISQEIRELSEKAIVVAAGGDIVEGENLAVNASDSLENVEELVEALRSTADEARCKWIDFRLRLKAVSTSVAKTIASLDLASAHASQAMELAHTYEKQALYTVSTTRNTPSLALSRHSTEFGKPVFDNSEGCWQLTPSPGTLGGDLADKVLDTEKRMADIEEALQEARELSERAIAVATDGDMEAGEDLAGKASDSLENVEELVEDLRSIADQARCAWVEFRRRLNQVTSSASAIAAALDLKVTQARRAATLAHSYEVQALEFVSTTRRNASQTLALHNAEFFETSGPVQRARREISEDAKRVRDLGTSLTEKVSSVEGAIGGVEFKAGNIRALLERAVTAVVNGDVAAGETLAGQAEGFVGDLDKRVQELCKASEGVRVDWVQLTVKGSTIPGQ